MKITLNEEQLKGLLLASAAHAPNYEAACAHVDKIIADVKDPESIVHNALDLGPCIEEK